MTELWPKASVHVVGLHSASACSLRVLLLSRVCGVYAFTVTNIKRSGNKGTSDLATACHGFIHPYVVRKHTQPHHALPWCVGGEAANPIGECIVKDKSERVLRIARECLALEAFRLLLCRRPRLSHFSTVIALR